MGEGGAGREGGIVVRIGEGHAGVAGLCEDVDGIEYGGVEVGGEESGAGGAGVFGAVAAPGGGEVAMDLQEFLTQHGLELCIHFNERKSGGYSVWIKDYWLQCRVGDNIMLRPTMGSGETISEAVSRFIDRMYWRDVDSTVKGGRVYENFQIIEVRDDLPDEEIAKEDFVPDPKTAIDLPVEGLTFECR